MGKLSDFHLFMKETVTIIRPMPSVVPRGNASPRDQQPSRSIRFQINELDAIDKAAELLTMSRSAFVKWCAYQVSLDVINQHKQFVERSDSS